MEQTVENHFYLKRKEVCESGLTPLKINMNTIDKEETAITKESDDRRNIIDDREDANDVEDGKEDSKDNFKNYRENADDKKYSQENDPNDKEDVKDKEYLKVNDFDDRDDADEDADKMDRVDRFGDNGEICFNSKSLNELKPFYNGNILDERIAIIRKSDYHIRQNWKDYDLFLTSLKKLLLEEGGLDLKDERSKADADKLLSSKRERLSKEDALRGDIEHTYEAIRLYTSKDGYDQVYHISNDVVRRENSIETEEMIRCAVFLVELMNIDLFNYCLRCPEQANFEGTVYRGMCVTDEEITAFRRLQKEPINRRNIAVPLGLFSSSSDINVAKKFVRKQLKNQKKDGLKLNPQIMKIKVIGLKPEYVELYTSTFPSIILTTSCAVDIHALSRYPDEKEVLLRGPFLLVLDMYEDDIHAFGHNKEPCIVVEAVMLNSDRDHIPSSFSGNLDALARDIISTMVTVTRSEYAVEYCMGKCLEEDARAYQAILDESCEKLKKLMTK